MIELQNFNLIKIDKTNEQQFSFLKELFQNKEDTAMDYLGNLTNMNDENSYIVLNNKKESIGYFSMSSPVINHMGLNSSSLYYAISPKYRGNGYGTKFIQEISDYLLENIDMLILKIAKENISSQRVAQKNNYEIIFEDDEDYIYGKSVVKKNKCK